ncbi:TonB-dependent receptor, partial [Desulfovibrio desulfuricans]|nr:TonB-dependent receptor [Desulfovibrio desulfuricans]
FMEARNLTSFLPKLRLDAFFQDNHKKMLNHVEANSGTTSVLMNNYADNTNEQWGARMQSDWALGESNYLIAGYEFNRDGMDADTNTYSNMSIPITPFMT